MFENGITFFSSSDQKLKKKKKKKKKNAYGFESFLRMCKFILILRHHLYICQKNNEIFKGKHTIIIKRVILKIDFIYGLLSLCFSFKI